MKTIEEKAKAYDEALERFKAFKEKYYTKDTVIGDAIFDKTGRMQKDFESIFPPEETEDERIRKELIEFIQWSVDRHFMREDFHQAKRPSEWIAYLEKQKYDRMKPIYDAKESFESALEKAWNDYHNGYENVDKLEDDYVECAHAKGFREGYLFGFEKQKEQKPIQTDAEKEYVRTLKSLVADFVRANNYIERGYYQQIYDWLDGRHVEQKEQKSAWSEEDEEDNIYLLLRMVDAVDSIPYINGTLRVSDEKKKELKEFIKRPRWKPSEEQIDALAYASQVLSSDLSPRAAKASKELESIREQLKQK